MKIPHPKTSDWKTAYGNWQGFVKAIRKSIGKKLGSGIVTMNRFKLLMMVCFLLTGCTTIYKVDDKGICRAPNGKIVPIPEVDLPKWACGKRWAKPIAGNQIYVSGSSWWGQKAGTCCGW